MNYESRLERIVFRWSALALVAVVAFALVAVYRTSGGAGFLQLAKSAAWSFFLIGKFVIFAGLKGGPLSIWELAGLVFLIDLCFAFALGSGLQGLERVPVVGSWLLRSRGRALEVLREYPGLRRMAFFGVVLFVLLPVAGTGAITGSFVARILGLSRSSGVLAIALASAWTSLAFALLAHFLGERASALLQSPVLAGTAIVLFVLFGCLLYSRFLKRLRAPE